MLMGMHRAGGMLDIGRAMALVPERPEAEPGHGPAAPAAAPVQAPAPVKPAAGAEEAPSLNSAPIKVSRPKIVLGDYPGANGDGDTSGGAAVTAKSVAAPLAAESAENPAAVSILQRFAGGFPLQDSSLVFSPRHGGSVSTCATGGVTAFPSDAAYGTDISAQLRDGSDDGYVIELGPQQPFEFGGNTMSSVVVRRDGSLLLRSGQASPAPAAAAMVREASLGGTAGSGQEAQIDVLGEAGLDLGQGGSVGWYLRPDRLVVSYRQVRSTAAVSGQLPSSFQVELFTAAGHYFAAGTVRMTWLGVGAPSGLIRLSSGAGTPAGLDLLHQVGWARCHTLHAHAPLSTSCHMMLHHGWTILV